MIVQATMEANIQRESDYRQQLNICQDDETKEEKSKGSCLGSETSSLSSTSSTPSLVTASSESPRFGIRAQQQQLVKSNNNPTSKANDQTNDLINDDEQDIEDCGSSSLASSMRSAHSSSSTVRQQSNGEEDQRSGCSCQEAKEDKQGVNNNNNNNNNNTNNNNNNNDSDRKFFKPSKSVAGHFKRYLSIEGFHTRRSSSASSKSSTSSTTNSSSNNDNDNNLKQLDHQMRQMNKLDSDESVEQLLSVNRRSIYITTCCEIYNQWRQTKRIYRKAPINGIQLQVDYIDTGTTLAEEIRERAPVVLLLHGAPGSYTDFRLLIQHLAGQTIRVIAPNFPEYTCTVKTKTMFRHSADEKASYLRDFLRAIDVNRIDLLVSHSSAVFPSLLILLNDNQNYHYESSSQMNNHENERKQQQVDDVQDRKNSKSNKRKQQLNVVPLAIHTNSPYHIEIRALALFNPAGHRLPQSMKPTWFKCGSVRIYQNKFGRAIFQKFGSGFLTIVGVPVRVDNMDHVMLSATVMRNSECQRVVQQLNYLNQLKLPTLLVFSENDKLIEKEIFYEMTQFMGLDKNQFDIFNHQGQIERAQSSRDDWIRVMVFKAGGHYAYSNYANTVNKAVTELLCKVCACSDATATTNKTKTATTGSSKGYQEEEKRSLKLMLAAQALQQHQKGINKQRVTLVTNGTMNAQIKRHFKW